MSANIPPAAIKKVLTGLDAEPLLIIVPDEQRTLRIASATTGRILRTMEEMGGGLVQNLLPAK